MLSMIGCALQSTHQPLRLRDKMFITTEKFVLTRCFQVPLLFFGDLIGRFEDQHEAHLPSTPERADRVMHLRGASKCLSFSTGGNLNGHSGDQHEAPLPFLLPKEPVVAKGG